MDIVEARRIVKANNRAPEPTEPTAYVTRSGSAWQVIWQGCPVWQGDRGAAIRYIAQHWPKQKPMEFRDGRFVDA